MSPITPTPDADAEAGAKQFRKLMLIVTAVYFVVLAVVCVNEYLSYLDHVTHKGDRLFVGLHEWATLTYYFTWCMISLLALVVALPRRTVWISFYICVVIFAETVCYVYFFATRLHLYQAPSRSSQASFDPHPFVIALPHPGGGIDGVTHDANHHRTTINLGKVAHPRLIYVFGGSTTYDIGNTDANTWPSQLSRLLGPDFDVENFGLLGFSSVESMTQNLFAFRNSPPACAIYYQGWNDLRNSHVKDLAVDYSNFEYPYLYESAAYSRRPGFLDANSLLVAYFLSMFDPPPPPTASGVVSDQQDMRLSKIYRDNIRLIAVIGKTFGVRVIFVPQQLAYTKMTDDSTWRGEPFIRAKDMKKLMGLMNQDMARAAGESQAYFLGTPLSENWADGDFLDRGHFSSAGALKFAQSISESVRKICQ
jgi:lysophospholipase L1-like esterase